MNGNSSESLRDTLPTTKSACTASASVSKATAWKSSAVRYLKSDEYRSRTPAEAGQAEGLGSHRTRRRIPNPTLVGGKAPKPPPTFFEKKVGKETFKQKIYPFMLEKERNLLSKTQKKNLIPAVVSEIKRCPFG